MSKELDKLFDGSDAHLLVGVDSRAAFEKEIIKYYDQDVGSPLTEGEKKCRST